MKMVSRIVAIVAVVVVMLTALSGFAAGDTPISNLKLTTPANGNGFSITNVSYIVVSNMNVSTMTMGGQTVTNLTGGSGTLVLNTWTNDAGNVTSQKVVTAGVTNIYYYGAGTGSAGGITNGQASVNFGTVTASNMQTVVGSVTGVVLTTANGGITNGQSVSFGPTRITSSSGGILNSPLIIKNTTPYGGLYDQYSVVVLDSNDAEVGWIRTDGTLRMGMIQGNLIGANSLGSATLPAFCNPNADSGIFFPNANEVGISANQKEMVRVTDSQITLRTNSIVMGTLQTVVSGATNRVLTTADNSTPVSTDKLWNGSYDYLALNSVSNTLDQFKITDDFSPSLLVGGNNSENIFKFGTQYFCWGGASDLVAIFTNLNVNSSVTTSYFGSAIYFLGNLNTNYLVATTNYIKYSTDFTNWNNSVYSPTALGLILDIQYGLGKYVAIRQGGISYSSNLVDWAASAGAPGCYSLTFWREKNMFLAAPFGDKMVYSTNGINWTACANGPTYARGFCSKDGIMVVGSANNPQGIWYSTNGINWTQSNITYGGDTRSIYYMDGLFLAPVGYNIVIPTITPCIYYSRDGIYWSSKLIKDVNATMDIRISGLVETNKLIVCTTVKPMIINTLAVTNKVVNYVPNAVTNITVTGPGSVSRTGANVAVTISDTTPIYQGIGYYGVVTDGITTLTVSPTQAVYWVSVTNNTTLRINWGSLNFTNKIATVEVVVAYLNLASTITWGDSANIYWVSGTPTFAAISTNFFVMRAFATNSVHANLQYTQ